MTHPSRIEGRGYDADLLIGYVGNNPLSTADKDGHAQQMISVVHKSQ
jgi:hypothetical protein